MCTGILETCEYDGFVPYETTSCCNRQLIHSDPYLRRYTFSDDDPSRLSPHALKSLHAANAYGYADADRYAYGYRYTPDKAYTHSNVHANKGTDSHVNGDGYARPEFHWVYPVH